MSQDGVLLHLDGTKVAALRNRARLTLEGFAALCGVSVRWIGAIEKENCDVSWDIANRIARTCRTDVESLISHRVFPDTPHVDLPGIGVHQKKLNRAAKYDMAGNHDEAIFICHRVLEKIGEDDFIARAVVLIRLATFLDNTGRHQEAIRRLELSGMPWSALNYHCAQSSDAKRLLAWAAYHRGIAHRRLKQWETARREFEPLFREPKTEHWPATKHQLGVVCLGLSEGHDAALLDEALRHFAESRTWWQREGNHREGFSLRRIGQVHALRGNFPDAVRSFVEAVEVFARCQCPRYVIETKKDVAEYVLNKWRAAAATWPESNPADVR